MAFVPSFDVRERSISEIAGPGPTATPVVTGANRFCRLGTAIQCGRKTSSTKIDVCTGDMTSISVHDATPPVDYIETCT
jgi:hypothetical protein